MNRSPPVIKDDHSGRQRGPRGEVTEAKNFLLVSAFLGDGAFLIYLQRTDLTKSQSQCFVTTGTSHFLDSALIPTQSFGIVGLGGDTILVQVFHSLQ